MDGVSFLQDKADFDLNGDAVDNATTTDRDETAGTTSRGMSSKTSPDSGTVAWRSCHAR